MPIQSDSSAQPGPAPGSANETVDLRAEADALRHSSLWQERGQSSRTLLKQPGLRLVLIALRSGSRIPQHSTHLRLCLQTLAGHVQLTLPDQTIDLAAGRLLVLDRAIPHDVVALQDSEILLSLSGPP